MCTSGATYTVFAISVKKPHDPIDAVREQNIRFEALDFPTRMARFEAKRSSHYLFLVVHDVPCESMCREHITCAFSVSGPVLVVRRMCGRVRSV